MTAPTGHCHLCDEPVPLRDLLGHLRARHPERYEPPETWPDGAPVVIDLGEPEWLR